MKSFNTFLKKELNKPQYKAVTQNTGAMLVVAGAGSGKTRVITARMANLILNEQTPPYSILALTFTNKAAGEMKERLTNFLGASSHLPFVGTFHSYCLFLLRSNPSLLNSIGANFSNFTIIDEHDQKSMLKKILKKNALDKQISATQLSYQISKVKNQLTRDEEIYKNPYFKELYLAYETEKASAHCLDFDDLLLTTLKIFQKNKSFKESFQSRIRHILIDEYQDTNGVQHEFLKQMALTHKNEFAIDSLCAVGDEDQSIYSWRGALVANMLSFQSDFSPVTMIKIEQNYRSVQPILKAANKVIEHNKNRHPKKLWSDKKAKNRILSITCQSGYQESDTIATYMQALDKKTKLQDLAILYRTHFQSRTIEESLIRKSIPYKIVGGIRFYERKEIKDILAYLRLLINPFDRTSLFRVINTPSRGLGAKFEELLYEEWLQNSLLDFQQILQLLIDTPKYKIKGVRAAAIKKFLGIFKKLKPTDMPIALLENILEKSEYLTYLRKAHEPHEADTKIENIQEFARSIEAFEKKAKDKPLLEDFLHEIALLQEKLESNDQESDQIQLMTLHAAKGLEFHTVVVAGLEEGLLPSTKSLYEDNALEEERRLFYVGMTRAKERLVLTRATYRNSYGQITDQEISRFLTEVPSRLLHHLDLTQIHPARIKTHLAQWLGSTTQETITTFGAYPFANKTPKKKSVSKKQPNTKKSKSPWKKNQFVVHKTFGPGLIKEVEPASKDTYYLTIYFKQGTKKVLSNFIKSL